MITKSDNNNDDEPFLAWYDTQAVVIRINKFLSLPPRVIAGIGDV